MTNTNSVVAVINKMKPQIEMALPKLGVTPERFIRVVFTAINQNNRLAETDQTSLLGAIMTSAQLGLEVNTPLQQAYLIPYGGKCQFQIGYKGLMELARRSGLVRKMEANIVYSNESFKYIKGTNPKLEHEPLLSDRGDMIAVYAIAWLKDGEYQFIVMSKDDVDAIRMRSVADKSTMSPWKTDYEAMAKKTAIKQLCKMLPQSLDLALATQVDSISEVGGYTKFDEMTKDIQIIDIQDKPESEISKEQKTIEAVKKGLNKSKEKTEEEKLTEVFEGEIQ